MLIEFSVANFKVFSQKQTLSMVAKKSYKEHLESTVIPKYFDDLLINKAAIIYGANGAGKSSLIEALDYLTSYIMRGFVDVDDDRVDKVKFIDRSIPKFVFDDKLITAPTDFDISFIGESGERYQYSISIGVEHIESEGLWVFSKKGVRAKTLISRVYNKETEEFDYYCPSLDIDKKTYEVAVEKAGNSKRSPFVSILMAYDVNQVKEFSSWFKHHLVISSNSKDENFRIASKYTFLDKLAAGDDDKKNKIIDFLSKFDFSITDISVEKRKIKLPDEMPDEVKRMVMANMGYHIAIEHTTSDGVKKNIAYEKLSSGTRKLFDLSGIITLCCDSCSDTILVLDEFESSLHPYIVRAIFDLMVKKPNNIQLILTTHSSVLLDIDKIARRDQIWFLEKNSDLETVLYPLSDFTPRLDDPIIRGWDTGRYGGVPYME